MSDNGVEAAASRMKNKLGSKREIRSLPDHLHDGEHVDMMTAGYYGGGSGLLALTDRRLLFLRDGRMSKTVEDFTYDRITSLQWKTGMVLGTITVTVAGSSAEITNLDKTTGKEIADAARARMGTATTTAPPSPGTDGPAERLQQLAELHTAGILTDEEYQAKRAALIAEL